MPPLDRPNMTEAEQITLPLYPLAYLLIGALFIAQPALRTSGPAFDPARLLLPMWAWGCLFALIAAVELAALASRRRQLYVRALIAGSGMAAFWLVLLVCAAAGSDRVSFSSAVWVLMATAAQIASARMLAGRTPPSCACNHHPREPTA